MYNYYDFLQDYKDHRYTAFLRKKEKLKKNEKKKRKNLLLYPRSPMLH